MESHTREISFSEGLLWEIVRRMGIFSSLRCPISALDHTKDRHVSSESSPTSGREGNHHAHDDYQHLMPLIRTFNLKLVIRSTYIEVPASPTRSNDGSQALLLCGSLF